MKNLLLYFLCSFCAPLYCSSTNPEDDLSLLKQLFPRKPDLSREVIIDILGDDGDGKFHHHIMTGRSVGRHMLELMNDYYVDDTNVRRFITLFDRSLDYTLPPEAITAILANFAWYTHLMKPRSEEKEIAIEMLLPIVTKFASATRELHDTQEKMLIAFARLAEEPLFYDDCLTQAKSIVAQRADLSTHFLTEHAVTADARSKKTGFAQLIHDLEKSAQRSSPPSKTCLVQ